MLLELNYNPLITVMSSPIQAQKFLNLAQRSYKTLELEIQQKPENF